MDGLFGLLNFQPIPPRPVDRVALGKAVAISVADHGETVIDRIAFWAGVAAIPIAQLIAERVLDRLADRLNEHSDEIERWMVAA